MQASILDLRYHMRDILKALDRREPVEVIFRGKPRGMLMPFMELTKKMDPSKHSAFGMWGKNKKVKNVEAYVRNLRSPRYTSI